MDNSTLEQREYLGKSVPRVEGSEMAADVVHPCNSKEPVWAGPRGQAGEGWPEAGEEGRK